MDIQIIEISKLKRAEYNPRKELTPEDPEYQQLKNSIVEFGYVVPVVVNKDYTVIGGHQGLTVLEDLGYKKIECSVQDLNKTQEKALNLALNKINGIWDNEKLEKILAELKELEFDMDITGFSPEELNEIFNDTLEATEDDFDVDKELEEIEEPITQLGDVWILGKHRLLCGDSTQKEAVAQLMNNQEADMVLTDPPYNVDVENSKGMKIKNDNMDNESFREFLTKSFKNLSEVLKAGGAFYIWFASKEHINFEKALNESGLKVRQELIWNKNMFILGNQDYQWKHEPCLYGWKEGAAHYFIDDRTQATVIEDRHQDFRKLKKEELIQILEDTYRERISTTIIEEDKPTINDLHPTMKPIKLLSRLIKNSSRVDECVLDLFGGSGSTLIACEQLSRTCYMMELDPKYCDVIIKRWETLTGKKAELEKK